MRTTSKGLPLEKKPRLSPAGKERLSTDEVAAAGKKVRGQVKNLANRGAEAIDAGKEAYEQSRAAG